MGEALSRLKGGPLKPGTQGKYGGHLRAVQGFGYFGEAPTHRVGELGGSREARTRNISNTNRELANFYEQAKNDFVLLEKSGRLARPNKANATIN